SKRVLSHPCCQEAAMPVPIVCLDAGVRQWMETFRTCLSKPQYQHVVTVLLGLLLCHEARTLTGLLRQVADGPSLASVSRFLAHAPWQPADLVQLWLARFRAQMAPVGQAAGVPFCSKLDLMVELVQRFVPVSGTRTHVLADSWYAAKRLWRAARDRGFLITTGLKANRSVRVPDATTERGWRWQRLDAYAAGLTADDFTRVDWPRQSEEEPRQVYVHVLS